MLSRWSLYCCAVTDSHTTRCMQVVFSYWSCDMIDEKLHNMNDYQLECFGAEHLAVSVFVGIPMLLM